MTTTQTPGPAGAAPESPSADPGVTTYPAPPRPSWHGHLPMGFPMVPGGMSRTPGSVVTRGGATCESPEVVPPGGLGAGGSLHDPNPQPPRPRPAPGLHDPEQPRPKPMPLPPREYCCQFCKPRVSGW